ncbi:hypothetical protein FGG08_005234 [Glutinoglossum americanum]|uniref:Uncharacterized protein n=1 Tax=Glutinoglossum americanum TaxID=1670608 RepID=A0A9P8HYN1_9PEZI|nr:hypothetical protein FGG08_005234 [Glutinoglossum americanum]
MQCTCSLKSNRGRKVIKIEVCGIAVISFENHGIRVNRPKIYAFIGIANDQSKGQLPVDYAKFPLAVYQDIIAFQNISALEPTEKRVDMVYLSGLVRRLLSRKSGLRKTPVIQIGKLWEAGSWINKFCSENDCSLEYVANMSVYYIFLDLLSSFKNWLLSFFVKPKADFTSIWYPSEPESAEMWLNKSSEMWAEDIVIRGVIIGQIQHIGPSYSEILASAEATKKWATSLIDRFPKKEELDKARSRNDRLMSLLGPSADFRIQNIASFEANMPSQDPSSQGFSKGTAKNSLPSRDNPRLFIGSNVTLGLVPPNSKTGDFLCQFWNSTASALLRQGADGTYRVIGRLGIVGDGEAIDWDMPMDRDAFSQTSKGATDLTIDILTLTRLSLDTVNLPGTP